MDVKNINGHYHILYFLRLTHSPDPLQLHDLTCVKYIKDIHFWLIQVISHFTTQQLAVPQLKNQATQKTC